MNFVDLEVPGLIVMDFFEFHRFSLNLMNFVIWEVSGKNAGGFKAQPAAPTRKNVGSLNPSKEQGARLDLSSLA